MKKVILGLAAIILVSLGTPVYADNFNYNSHMACAIAMGNYQTQADNLGFMALYQFLINFVSAGGGTTDCTNGTCVYTSQAGCNWVNNPL